ncbi:MULTISPECIES: DUF456 domain-containing protein [Shouchella]|jgi:uncharacterized protein|uniref:DUF456 domain-containing protein n=3 Tax=Shouchella TaxID=2893057 RepID=Q5WB35_SHOC1|nr:MULTISPECIES: DUF456 domain-containing protein [Shouchella]MCM3311229.1 DUF456 domain-containing protein [Psychrobacillus sp. MER TA 17]PAD40734.1 DUF456 domain-containing protein [Bacillus sp. 7520-S]KKI84929.1 membrane protein [Shouchella clausii]MBU8595787.1 DUF456 domain-containing protein [Shouchella clausii]MBX0318864.1 DUF456 domain-containing protein [Shouchella clausii]
MDTLWWLVIAVFFIASFVGLIVPIIPSVLVLWGGFLVYVFALEGSLSVVFWVGMAVLTVFLLVVDLLANMAFVKRTGGSKWGERAALVGVIVGAFVVPPFGLIIVPFVLVLIAELLQKQPFEKAVRIAFASFLAFISGTLAKAVVQIVMIAWFLIEVL